MLLAALLLACTPKTEAPTEPAAPEPVAVVRPAVGPLLEGPPAGMPGATAHVETLIVGGEELPLALQPVVRAGDVVQGVQIGGMFDTAGKPLSWPDRIADHPADPMVCNILDFAALLQHEDQWFHLSHSECVVGGVNVVPVAFDEAGKVSVSGPPKPVDFSGVGGTTTNCAGDITPWNTFLSSEEYEANARLALEDGTLPPEQVAMDTKHPYEWSFLNEQLAYKGSVSPYELGWIPEIRVTDSSGSTRVDKRYAMGRFSHELALVMPDQKTVYLTDDQYHGGFFLFIADKKADLSAGTLYAAHWKQSSDLTADLDWVSLGHATDAELEAAIRGGVRFGDLFDAEPLSEENTCPAGFSRSTTTWGTECLKAKQPVLASRLESRRMAGLLGATTEFTKGEGLAVDPAGGDPSKAVVYFATSKVTVGMLEEQSEVRGPGVGDYRRTEQTDHIRLPANPCGIVWGMRPGEGTDRDGNPMASDWVVRSTVAAVSGVPAPEGKACAEDAIANPDNITFAEDYGWLWIAEDTTKHEADTLWVADDPKPQPVLKVDGHGEVTGVHWFHVGDWRYLTVANQWDHDVYPETRSVSALLGPFPALGDDAR